MDSLNTTSEFCSIVHQFIQCLFSLSSLSLQLPLHYSTLIVMVGIMQVSNEQWKKQLYSGCDPAASHSTQGLHSMENQTAASSRG